MLSPHTVVIAAIFVPYMGLMTGLGVYIWRTGQPRGQEYDDGAGEPELAPVAVVAEWPRAPLSA